MAVKGITFDQQTVTARNDGFVNELVTGSSDVLISSTTPAITSVNVITLYEGYMLIHGRLIHIDGTTNISVTPGSVLTNGVGRLLVHIDTSETSTPLSNPQLDIQEDYATTVQNFRNLTQDDINTTGTVYEAEILRFTVSSGSISSLTTSLSTVMPMAEVRSKVSAVTYSSNAIKQTVNGTTSTVVSVSTLKTDMAFAKGDIGIYVQSSTPGSAVDGDIWIDTSTLS